MDSRQIKKVVERRHPRYGEMYAHWNFLEKSYDGGRAWFEDNIFQYVKEGNSEYKSRIARAYRFNHTREVVDLVNKYLFRAKVMRSEDAPEHVLNFWKSATLGGLDINEFMQMASTKSSTLGCPWVVVDNDVEVAEGASVADVEKATASKETRGVYAYIVRPQDVLDVGYDDYGDVTWILIREATRDDEDPLTATGDVGERFRLWTKDSWMLFEKKGRKWEQSGTDDHNLGMVPAVRVDNTFCSDPYVTPALIADVAYLDRAVSNYLSNLDAIIQDQTFSQMAMPAQGILPGDDAYDKMLEMGTKRIFIYDGEHGAKPEFLSPDPRQAGLIISAIQQLINEIYHSVGLAGERTKQDNAKGIDNSSGVAKAADFDRVLALLSAKASALETVENKIVEIVNAWHGKDDDSDVVIYSETFDVRDLASELEIATTVQTLDAPAIVIAEEMKLVVEKLFPNMKVQLLDRMKTEIDTWSKEREKANSLIPPPIGITKPSEQLPEPPVDKAKAGKKQSESKASRD